tara:strand:- start:57 stop:530 length:474 start_codon:yes stop_codon:yes gene_type:complete
MLRLIAIANSILGDIVMFSKDNDNEDAKDALSQRRESKNVFIGNGVKIKGEITDADLVQIDGSADVTMETDNLMVGVGGDLKGTVTAHNSEVWGKLDGDVKISGTLTIQEQGSVSGNIEYENLQVKLGGQISGDIKVTKTKKDDPKPIDDFNEDFDE